MPCSELVKSLAGRRVTVIGLGREGLDLAPYLVAEGARVLVTDQRPASELTAELSELGGLPLRYALGGHPPEQVLAADLIFVSPGVPPELGVLEAAHRQEIPVTSASALFLARCPAPIIGITGSSGKSTTTALVGEVLAAAGRKTLVGGNIGRPLLGHLGELDRDSVVVMELSSFQLESVDQGPWIATVTNVTPNHLDRHPSMAAYVAAKRRIFEFQRPTDWTVLNADDPISRDFHPPAQTAWFSLERPVEGGYLDGEVLRLVLGGRSQVVLGRSELALRGRHNLANALTACTVATLAGAPIESLRQALRSFRGLPHRLECVGEIDGVRFFNDSIATAPERSIAGLVAFDEPLVLLAGGRDKHLPMDDWASVIRRRVGGVVLFGEAAPLIRAALEQTGYPADRIRAADDMLGAARQGLALADPGAVVLLSPGCTSFDMFRDFTARGRAFAEAVDQLTRERA